MLNNKAVKRTKTKEKKKGKKKGGAVLLIQMAYLLDIHLPAYNKKPSK